MQCTHPRLSQRCSCHAEAAAITAHLLPYCAPVLVSLPLPLTPPQNPAGDPALLPWFLNFMKGYVSVPQVAKLFAVTTALAVFTHAPIPSQVLFWAGSGLVSAVRLFYFGTYVPHKPRKGANEVMAWAKARSVDHAPALLSFLQCYNFGMHWEHHRWGGGAGAGSIGGGD